MTTFAIAGIQMNVAYADNMQAMSRQIKTAMARFPWIKMIVFPELAAFGPNLQSAQPLPGPAEEHFCGLAKKYKIWLIPGSLYELDNGKIYNTAPVISPDGTVVARHRKIYPFMPYEEGIESGKDHTLFNVPNVGCFGVSICYDKWFPETTRALACMGAEVIIHPTMTDTMDRDFELSLTRVNAGINQCYFFDVNCTGEMGYGCSIIAGPEGEVIHQANIGEELMPIRVDMNKVRQIREEGLMGLGQPLKSFRDTSIEFPQYHKKERMPGLNKLKQLRKPN